MMKALVWEPGGYWVLARRLDQGRFQVFEQAGDHEARFELTSSELALLLDGIDLRAAERTRIRKETMQRLND